MTRVIIDTSAWVDFFRRQTGVTGDAVAGLIERDLAVTTGPVLAELLQGLKSRKEAERLNDLLRVVPYLEPERMDWEQAGTILCCLRRRGVTVPVTDALISVVAKRHGCSVLTLDKHFEHLEIPLYAP
jgi:predicted nucleic acid-binding protein